VNVRRCCAGLLGLARALLLVLAFAVPAVAAAQSLRDLALAWVQGDFRAPLVCVIDGASRQALRRVRIHSAPRGTALPSVRVTFYDLEAPPGTTCGGVAHGDEPNVKGGLELVFEGRSRPDTGEVDFRNAMRRDGGFTFRIQSGQLQLGPAGGPPEALKGSDYAGGTARIVSLAPGSDAARRLAPFGAHRQLQLEIEAEGAPPLAFDLVELNPR
jgi:hypothetical protein